MTNPGWVYVLTHPAWDKLGMVKVGRTGRDPRTRAREITSVSGLLAFAIVAWCSPVSDMAAAEQAVHRMRGSHRVRKCCELFRVVVAAPSIWQLAGLRMSQVAGRDDNVRRSQLRRLPLPGRDHQPRRLALLPLPAQLADGG